VGFLVAFEVGFKESFLSSSLSFAQVVWLSADCSEARGGGRVCWLTECSGLLRGLDDRVYWWASKVDCLVASAIEENSQDGLLHLCDQVQLQNELPPLLCDRVYLAEWIAWFSLRSSRSVWTD